jgi:hypothetical protein
LDSDIPPPLDDKIRDNDFDLDEEIIEDNLANNCFELPELPTDFNVFSSASTDDNISYSHPPPELNSFVIAASPPPDSEDDKKEECDVAREKESSSDVSQVLGDQMEGGDDREEGKASGRVKEEEISEIPEDLSTEVDKSEEEAVEVKAANDDDFDDFVSGVEAEPQVNITEEKFEESPEHIPQLKLDDEDDEFNDFESATVASQPPVQIIQKTVEEPAPQVVQFEADFSSFNAFQDAGEDESAFDDFQESKVTTGVVESQLDDDDDFGDFSDFTQAPASIQTTVEKPADVNGILGMMFPATETVETATTIVKADDQVIKSDSFVNKFNDFDSTLALGYLYNSSKASQTLVKALGIDTRNIVSSFDLPPPPTLIAISPKFQLLGPQWASASSNMPRFAANMSFNPIEPLKPLNSSAEPPKPVLQPVKAKSDVPEVEFDWNSAGLINPLDGKPPAVLLASLFADFSSVCYRFFAAF